MRGRSTSTSAAAALGRGHHLPHRTVVEGLHRTGAVGQQGETVTGGQGRAQGPGAEPAAGREQRRPSGCRRRRRSPAAGRARAPTGRGRAAPTGRSGAATCPSAATKVLAPAPPEPGITPTVRAVARPPSTTSPISSTSQASPDGQLDHVAGADAQRGPERAVGDGSGADHVHVVVPGRPVRGEPLDDVGPDEDERGRRPGPQRAVGVVGHVEGHPGGRGQPEQVAEEHVVVGGQQHREREVGRTAPGRWSVVVMTRRCPRPATGRRATDPWLGTTPGRPRLGTQGAAGAGGHRAKGAAPGRGGVTGGRVGQARGESPDPRPATGGMPLGLVVYAPLVLPRRRFPMVARPLPHVALTMLASTPVAEASARRPTGTLRDGHAGPGTRAADVRPDSGRERWTTMAPRATGRPAAFFDLDKTIIAKSSTLAFSRSFQAGGLISRRAVLRSAYAQFVYLVGGADHDQMEKMREFLSDLCAGWDVQTVRDIVARDPAHHRRPAGLRRGDVAHRGAPARRPRRRHRVRVRGGGRRADRRDARRRRGDRHPHADRRRPLHRRDRLLRLRPRTRRPPSPSWPWRRATTSAGASPTATRSPTSTCSRSVGHPHAVNPDRELRRQATQRGWPVLVFTRPVALRSRMRLPQGKPTMAALALGTAAAVGGMVYVAARRACRPRDRRSRS